MDVRGKIVLARYGGGWRGLKPKLAQEHGAVGCLIYSDPADDSYAEADVYPKGGGRPEAGVQRGSVADMPVYPGDPLTPGVGATPGARRLTRAQAITLLKIPTLPISYGDASKIIAALQGPLVTGRQRGALGLAYHWGGTDAVKVHLAVKSDWSLKPVYDVIGMLRGSTYPDQWIIRGNHHDGWVFGAFDPLAGMVTELAEAKALGTLYKQGWKPKRTIVYASWDGEEPGLLGSTEWAETHAKELQQKAVMYVNSDTNGRGILFAGGSHSLQHLVNQVAAGVTDPETQASVQQRQRAYLDVQAAEKNASPTMKEYAKLAGTNGDIPIAPLGSGSDYSAFLEHLGIATLDLGFEGESNQGGVYHSRYDDFDHFDRFGDPGFKYEVALAKVAGHIVMRSADAEVLPMRFGDFSSTLDRYVDALHKQVDNARKEAEAQHKLLDAGAYKLAADPLHPVAPPERLSDVPQIAFAPLDTAAKKLKESAQAYEKAYDARAQKGLDIPAAQLTQVNQLMATMEQRLLDAQGLPGRPWFKNMVQAPGELTGYAPKTIPAVHEALDARDWSRADKYAAVTANVLDGYRAQLDKLTALLQK
ncbi:MAG TPA: transferrin receptor-like dimerization domain-containing protein [Rhodanobacteraceae bacterium]|nr:transferrin receptor-like dimerization domain-containing protein [Rhodanobacteraceae bacterium]